MWLHAGRQALQVQGSGGSANAMAAQADSQQAIAFLTQVPALHLHRITYPSQHIQCVAKLVFGDCWTQLLRCLSHAGQVHRGKRSCAASGPGQLQGARSVKALVLLRTSIDVQPQQQPCACSSECCASTGITAAA